MMLAANYPERAAHLVEHRTLVDEFDTLLDSVDLLSDEQLYIAIDFIRGWFAGHVMTGDARLGLYLRERVALVSPGR